MSTGRFLWHELMTSDVDGAVEFYSKVLGWEFHDSDGEMPYKVLNDGYQDTGGVLDLSQLSSEGVPPNWMPYVSVDHFDRALRKVELLGGTVIMSDETAGMKFATIQSDDGAVLGILKMEEPPEREGRPRSGEFCWYSLGATDVEKAPDFWNELFDWRCEETDIGGGTMQHVFYRGDAQIAGLQQVPPGHDFGFWAMAVAVDDLDGTLEKAVGHGAQVIMPPAPVGEMGKMVVIADPAGAMLSFFEAGF